MKQKIISHQKGFTLVEILVSITMTVIFAMAFFPIISWLTVRSRQFQYSTQAGELLQEGMEATYNVMLSTDNWEDVGNGIYHPVVDTTGENHKWELAADPETGLETRFGRRIELSKICRNSNTGERADCSATSVEDRKSRLVTVQVEWNENQAAKHATAYLLLTKI